MSGPLTTKEIMDAVVDVRPHVEELTEAYKQAAIAHARAKTELEVAEAKAFLEAKNQKATDEMARRFALLAVSEQKERVDQLAAEKASARLGTDAWQHVLDVYVALSHTLNRELKTFAGVA